MQKFKEILSGYKNYFKENDEVVEKEAKRRADICAKCPLAKKGIHAALLRDGTLNDIQGLYCSACGCPLSPKVRSTNSKCPKDKW